MEEMAGVAWTRAGGGRVAAIDSTCIFRTPSLLLLLRPTNAAKYQIPWVALIDSSVCSLYDPPGTLMVRSLARSACLLFMKLN